MEIHGVIYKITNTVNGKVYIGQTTKSFNERYKVKGEGIERVYNYHKRNKEDNTRHFNAHLYNSIEKYGFNKFEISYTYDVAFSQIELNIKERMYISLFNSMDGRFGYNKQEGGVGGRNNDEVIVKMLNTMIEKDMTRQVKQLEIPSLKVINTYSSIASATKSLNLTRSAIKNVLNPKYKSSLTAGGYAWEYVDEKNKKYENVDFHEKEKLEKSIVDLYLKGYTYEEISKFLTIHKSRISPVLTKNNIKTSKYLTVEEATRKRKEVIYYYLKGYKQCEIMKITGYTKPIVEKALAKYRRKEIDENGNKI